jgi:hypothetical protein
MKKKKRGTDFEKSFGKDLVERKISLLLPRNRKAKAKMVS